MDVERKTGREAWTPVGHDANTKLRTSSDIHGKNPGTVPGFFSHLNEFAPVQKTFAA